jgi:hypothetical protein
LLVTAVVAVMIVFATNKSGGLQGQLNKVLTNVSNEIGDEGNYLAGSHSHDSGTTPTGGTGTFSIDVTKGLN